jgi:hypothetical protein
MDHVRSIKFDRLRPIACQRMHAYQDWTYVRIQDRRSHATSVRTRQAVARGKRSHGASGRTEQAAARGKPIMLA